MSEYKERRALLERRRTSPFLTYMLDLYSRVHLHEVVIAVLIHEEFHRTRVPVLVHREQPTRIAEYILPGLAGQSRGGCRLYHLLMPTLDGAIPIVQVHDVSGAIPQALHLDVTGTIDVLLHEAPAVPERVEGLVAREAEHGVHVVGRGHDAYAPSPPAHRRLDDHGVRDRIGRVVYPRLGFRGRAEGAIGSVDYGHVRYYLGCWIGDAMMMMMMGDDGRKSIKTLFIYEYLQRIISMLYNAK